MTLPRRLALLLVLAFVASAGSAEAGVNSFWKELGGSASGGGISKLTPPATGLDAWVAVGADGRPVVAYAQFSDAGDPEGAIVVKRWTGTAWQTLSGPAGVGRGSRPQIRVSSTGGYYVAWLQQDDIGAQVRLVRSLAASPTVFQALGSSNTSGGVSALNASGVADFSLALAVDVPLVAFSTLAQTGIFPGDEGVLDGQFQVYVRRFNASTQMWQYLGSDPFTGGGASHAPSLFVDGGSSYAFHFAGSPSLAVRSDGTPLLAFQYGTFYDDSETPGFGTPPADFIANNTEIFVKQFSNNSSSWTVLPAVGSGFDLDGDSPATRGGLGGVSASADPSGPPSLATGPSNAIWVAWLDGNNVFVRGFSGMSWDEVAGSATGNGISDPTFDNGHPRVAVTPSGEPIVAWDSTDLSGVTQVFVKRGRATFEEMGPDSADGDGISAATLGVFSLMIAAPPSGIAGPAVVWLDIQSDNDQVFLRQFSTVAAFALNVSVVGGGNVSSVTSNPSGIDCPSDACTALFPSGQVVALTPNAGPNMRFDRWTGACTGSAACNVTMTAQKNVSAFFVAAATLTVEKIGNGLGTITSTPVGITCGAGGTDCDQTYALGTLVTLTAVTPAGTIFNGWGGDCGLRGTNTTCPLTMSAQRSADATFAQRVYQLDVAVTTPPGTAGQGGIGMVVDAFNTIECNPNNVGACSESVDHGTRIVLHAFALEGNRFLNWTGTVCGGRTNATCDFTMTSNRATTALFRGVTGLAVNKLGNGANVSGNRVTFAGNGFAGSSIDCGSDCIGQAFTNNSTLFTATVATGSNLDPNGGACTWTGSGATRTCSFLPQGLNQSILATFTQVKRRLFVTGAAGTTQGFATSSPPGIDCGNFGGHSFCNADYDFGTQVDLTPFPDTNSRFDRWVSGCSSIVANPNDPIRPICRVNMTANITVVKNFVNARLLSLNASGNGAGKITATTAPPLTCTQPLGGSCSVSQLVSTNTSVVLTPTAATGSNFRWLTSDCPSTGGSPTGPCTVKMSQNRSGIGQFLLNVHRLNVSRTGNGSILSTNLVGDVIDCGTSTTDCTTNQDFGTLIGLQATADIGFKFTTWTGTSPCSVGTQATNSSCLFQVKGNVTTIANFRRTTLVNLFKTGNAPNSNGQGTLTATGTLGIGPTFTTPASTVTCGLTCGNTSFAAFDGKLVRLSATKSIGSDFLGFSGACTTTNSSCSFTPSGANVTVTGQFVLQQFLLTVGNSSRGTVVSTTPPGIINCSTAGSDCSETLNFSTPVTLQAIANPDFIFVNWTGDAVCSGKTTPTCSFTVPTRNVSVTPNYRSRTAVTLFKTGNAPNSNGQGTLTATGTLGIGPAFTTPASTVTCGLTCGNTSFSAFDGKLVRLSATKSIGSDFVGFTGACTTTNSSCSFTPSGANQTVTGQFVLQQFTLTVTDRPNGSVTSMPGAIDCGFSGNDCTEVFNFGTPVTLGATPNDGVLFTSWTGDAVCAGKTTPTCSFTVPTRNVSVTPNYRVSTLVNVVKSGNGPGTVTSLPAGISCGTDCSERFFDGVAVRLTAAPSTGSDFLGFSGASCLPPPGNTSTPNVCTFVPVGNTQNVSATFALQSRTVNLTVAGDGQVTSGMFGCDATSSPCAFSGNFGSSVVFTSTPGMGNRVLSQTGCNTMTTGTNASTCTVILNQATGNKSAAVTFSFLMSVTKFGDGTGTVTSTPAGINCGTDCSQQYTPGVVVTLNRTAATGSTLGPWTDECDFRGTNASCTLTMSSNRLATAGFFGPQPLTVILAGGGNGSVTSSPIGITCPGDCSQPYTFGTQVTLTATAANGSVFTSFTGCDSTPNNSCVVTMSGNRSVTATFDVMIMMNNDPQIFIASATVTVPPPAVAVEPVPVALVSPAARLEGRLFDRIRRFARRA